VNTRKCSLLVVDDEPHVLQTVALEFASTFEVFTADSAAAAMQIFGNRDVNLLLTDQKMPRVTGVELLEWVRERYPKTIRLLMTGHSEVDDAVEAINRGHVYQYLLKPWRTEELHHALHNACDRFLLERKAEEGETELRRLNRELVKLTEALEERVIERTRALEKAYRELEERERELQKLARTDLLTGLLNRRAMEEAGRKELKGRERHPEPLAFGLIDIDFFHEVNHRFELTGGDEVLRALAKRLAHCLREADYLGRVGGEEFLVIAPHTETDGARVLAERIRTTVEATAIPYNGKTICVTVSVGFASAESAVAVDYDQMYHAAAAAENKAKQAGRNRCVLHTLGEALCQVEQLTPSSARVK
jgi:diguanylate cyclase